MENNQQQILSEIKSLMTSVRVQLEQLDALMAQFQQTYEPQEYDVEPIEMDFDVVPGLIDDLPSYEDVAVSHVEEHEKVEEPEVEPDVQSEPVEEAIVEHIEETVVEPEPVEEEEPVLLLEPELIQQPSVPSAPVAVIDVMATKHAWRSDMPGTAVKDVRAAIALVDRALFINALFSGDAMAFMDTLNHINQAESLDSVVTYLTETYPQWDFNSDVVYRFMMAVRRKVNN